MHYREVGRVRWGCGAAPAWAELEAAAASLGEVLPSAGFPSVGIFSIKFPEMLGEQRGGEEGRILGDPSMTWMGIHSGGC